jgi:D-alanine transaminase
MDIVYLNGQFIAADQAKISVFDRGFLFSDSVYEVIPFYAGEGFQLEQHIERLKVSLAALSIESEDNYSEITHKLVTKNNIANCSVYLQVTRGADTKRRHSINESLKPTVFACINPIVNNYALVASDVSGIKVIVCEDLRWKRCDIKSTSLLPNILAIDQARQQGAQEALLINEGKVLEGASSNLFLVENNTIITPPSSHAILNGTTSQLVQQVAREQDIEILHEDISYQRLLSAQEVWITSSTRGLLPVLQVDDKKIAGGEKGVLWQNLYGLLGKAQAGLLKETDQ